MNTQMHGQITRNRKRKCQQHSDIKISNTHIIKTETGSYLVMYTIF